MLRQTLRIGILISILFTFIVDKGTAQSWQQVFDEIMMPEETDEESAPLLTDSYELLEQLAAQPIDINHASPQQLEQLPFLSAQQVMDIHDYLHRYGPMRSLGELRMIPSLDNRLLRLLPFFVYVSDDADPLPVSKPRLDSILLHARHTLTGNLRIPFYTREGDRNGYLGPRLRHMFRYELDSPSHLRLGIIGAQDAGEPFFANRNRWGYDLYSYYLQLKNIGILDNLVIGKYKITAGKGLVLGQSFRLGKLATLQNLGRTPATIRPHGSRSESDYFQGAAATVSLSAPFSLSAFASYRPVDATLTDDDDARTLITNGYHRTLQEMQKKHNTHIAAFGSHFDYHRGALRLGATAVFSTLDRNLQPQRETLYRRHYAHGRNFFNASADYTFNLHRFSFSGETAVNDHGRLATTNTLSLQTSEHLSLIALQRFYSYRYTSLYGHSFGESSQVQNESGLYLGATWQPFSRLQLQAYADYAHFPWARYLVSRSSNSWDFLFQTTLHLYRWTLLARHRSHLQQRDNAAKTALVSNDDHRQRISITYSENIWTLRTQLDLAHHRYEHTEHGWMLSQQATIAFNSIQMNLLAAYFNTPSYQSRIYIYEHQLQHDFYFPTYSGEGLRLSLHATAHLSPHLLLAAKLGYTNYFDRSTIGTALQAIHHSHQTDLDLQLRWKF